MAGKRKAEYALFDCHGCDCEPEVDESTVEASQKEDDDDEIFADNLDDDEIISEEEYAAMMAESQARKDEECLQMFARLGLRPSDYFHDVEEEEEEGEEEDVDDDEYDGDMEEPALGPSNRDGELIAV